MAAAVTVIAMTGGEDGPSTEGYLAALDDEGVSDEFTSDRAATRSAERLCEDIASGDVDPVGPAQDRIGIEFFCPEFSEEFDELETENIAGEFLLDDSDSFSFYDSGDPCSGSGGYSDIGPGAQVQVKDESGTVLGVTSLGSGQADGFGGCVFEFTVELTEGSEQYLFEVGSRGQIAYSWTDLTTTGASLVLG